MLFQFYGFNLFRITDGLFKSAICLNLTLGDAMIFVLVDNAFVILKSLGAINI